ncbi:type I glyceraldehyde-3-phosphate dehydrogenase [Patescibacteria group bacterium]|nr:type I glyceraldehyde-3-phosphate dehydrogenase [Patescibacteria group bacterium]
MVRIAINGFGRIGRIALRVLFQRYREEARIVAINTSGSMEVSGWGQLLKYDSTFRSFSGTVEWDEADLIVNQERVAVLSQRDPAKIPWGRYGVDVVLEATGAFRKNEDAVKHLNSGAKRVVLSANPKGKGVPIFIKGINLDKYKQEKVVSCGSCTTNCVALICKVMLENFTVEKGEMTTVHAVTSDQRLLDGSHEDLRRARSALNNTVPTTSGAAQAVVAVLPQLKNRFSAMALRVPVVTGSFSDLTFVLGKKTTSQKINAVLKKAAEEELKGVMSYSTEPLVSSDVIGSPFSCVVDSQLTQVVDGDLVRLGAWYDNEWGYSCRLVEEAIHVGRHAA